MNLVVVLLCLCVALGGVAHRRTEPTPLTMAAYQALVTDAIESRENIRIALLVHEKHCPMCKDIMAVWPDLASAHPSFQFHTIEVIRDAELATHIGGHGVPTILVETMHTGDRTRFMGAPTFEKVDAWLTAVEKKK